jgi:ATP/maltotriose-dependent transcriptional regulator MalT
MGFRRPFVAHRERLRPLLGRLDEDARAATFALVGATAPAAGGEVSLSARERQVLAAIALGLPNQMIARRLFISLATVKTHVQHIFAKLAVDNRTAAVRRGRSLGLIEDD